MSAGSSRRRLLVGIGVALVATAAVVVLVRSRESNDEPGVYVHAGPRTTWITGPLRPDGTVDYVAHARAEMARGVTPENDLAPVMSLCLEKPLRRVAPASELPRPPAPLVSWSTWAYAHSLDQDSTKEAGESVADPIADAERAWLAGRTDGPLAAEMKRWLAEIGPALDLLQREARTRDHWFVPPAEIALDRAELLTSLKTIVPCYCERALARNADGDAKGAVADLATAFELMGRWRGCQGSIGWLAVLACEWYATQTVETLAKGASKWTCADFRSVDAARSRSLRNSELADVLPWERIAQLDRTVEIVLDPDAIKRAMKYSEYVQDAMRSVAAGDGSGAPSRLPESPGGEAHRAAISAREMDHLLEAINDRYDAFFALLVPPADWDARIDAVEKQRAELTDSSRKMRPHFWDFWREHTPTEMSARDPESMADLLLSLGAPLWRSILETVVTTTVAADAARMRLALACFKNEHGRNAANEAELVAACFDAPPLDRLYGAPLHWTIGADGSIDVTARGRPLAERLMAKRSR
jgi:hypothetical protein